MTVLAGRRLASTAEVVLAPADADGPPLAGLLWPHESEYLITSQSPAAEALVRRHQSVTITYDKIDSAGPDSVGVGELRRPSPTPGGVEAFRLVNDDEFDTEQVDR